MKIDKTYHELKLTEKRKVIVLNNKKKTKNGTKNYYSYQLNIPLNHVLKLVPNYKEIPQQQKYYLIEINPQKYQIILTEKEINNAIPFTWNLEKLQDKKDGKNIPYTLPKKYMAYLQAYDKYLDAMTNKEMQDLETSPLFADIELIVKVNKDPNIQDDLQIELYININTDINNEFVEKVKKENQEMGIHDIPGWIDTLRINWHEFNLSDYK